MPSQKVVVPADYTDGPTQRLHHRERTVTIAGASTVVQEQQVMAQRLAEVYARYAVSTFRTTGVTAAWQPVLVLENNYHLHVDYGTTPPMVLTVRRVGGIVELLTAAATAANRPRFWAYRTAETATGGTDLTRHRFDTSGTIITNNPHRVVGASSGDGVATPIGGIAAPAVGVTPAWTDPHDTLMGADVTLSAGQWLCHEEPLLPGLLDSDPLQLRPAERLVVGVVGAGYAELGYTINLVYEEGIIP